MQQRLALAPPAVKISTTTVFLELGDVPPDCAPTFDLTLIILTTTAKIITAVPLKPSPRVFVINPPFPTPD